LSDEKLYPNRVLKSLLEESNEPPLSATIKFLETALKNENIEERESQIAEALERLLSELSDLPEAYSCPITFRPMRDPVIDPEGNTFDRVVIVDWLEEKGTSPITRNPIDLQDLYPNHVMSLSHTLKQLRTSLRQWKETRRAREVDFFNEILSICAAGETTTLRLQKKRTMSFPDQTLQAHGHHVAWLLLGHPHRRRHPEEEDGGRLFLQTFQVVVLRFHFCSFRLT
jgi:hypothetical protein